MSQEVTPYSFESLLDSSEQNNKQADVEALIAELDVSCAVQVGTLKLSVAQLKSLKQGQVINLEQGVDAPVELVLNGKAIARGQLVCVDDCYGLQLTEVL